MVENGNRMLIMLSCTGNFNALSGLDLYLNLRDDVLFAISVYGNGTVFLCDFVGQMLNCN